MSARSSSVSSYGSSGNGEALVHAVTLAHRAGSRSSSSTNRKALNPSAYRTPLLRQRRNALRPVPGPAVRRPPVPWDTWAASASSFVSIESEMSTKVSGVRGREPQVRHLERLEPLVQQLGEHRPRRRVGHHHGEREQPGLLVVPVVDVARSRTTAARDRARPAPRAAGGGPLGRPCGGCRGSPRACRRPRRGTSRSSRPSTSAAARCSRSRTGAISARVIPGSFEPADPSVMTT